MARDITGLAGLSSLSIAVDFVKLPIVDVARLTDPEDPINSYADSGKELGASVWAFDENSGSPTLTLMVAMGRNASDEWQPASADSSDPYVLPAATQVAIGGVKQTIAVTNATATTSASVSASTATTVPLLVTDFNNLVTQFNAVRATNSSVFTQFNQLLTQLRAAGIIST